MKGPFDRFKSPHRDINKLIKKQEDKEKISIVQSVKGYFTNFTYEFQGFKLPFFSKGHPQQIKGSNQIFIAGKKMGSFAQCLKTHQEIIWFTYKKNFKINLTIHSDIGWGCLIRVAQMLMAESLRRFYSLTSSNVPSCFIITPFLESEPKSKYSISKFIHKAQSLFLKKAGSWYSITEVAMILKDLHDENPLKGSQNLKIQVCTQSIQIKKLKKYLVQQQNLSNELSNGFSKSRSKQLQITSNRTFLTLSQPKQEVKKHILLIVVANLGEQTVLEKNYNALLDLMKKPIFIGCLGGVPKKARFLTGCNDSKISYLDPHHVEERVDKMMLQRELDKFTCKDYRLLTKEELDPNMGICFYLKTEADLCQLVDSIEEVKVKHQQNFIRCDKEMNFHKKNSSIYQVQLEQFNPHTQNDQKESFQCLQLSEDSFSDFNSGGSMDSSFYMD